ncbi:hypothetical protein NEAUS03_0035 [Nematocida ausubeli]|nr:hypothetical protein NEAUS03_0035 [Nematocida ausubeli]
MVVQEKLNSIQVISGEVQRKVRDWEIQIIANSAGKHLRSLCDTYFRIEESSLKDELRERILRREAFSEKTIYTAYTKEKEKEVSSVNKQEEESLPEKKEDKLVSLSVEELDKIEPFSHKGCEIVEVHEKDPVSNGSNEGIEAKMQIARELRKQIMEKSIYIIDMDALEKLHWQDIISYLLDVVKTTGYMPAVANRKQHRNLVCFNCDKKGHIVKNCPSKATKKQRPS